MFLGFLRSRTDEFDWGMGVKKQESSSSKSETSEKDI